jgi:mediator of RNA polymerase II transcription subunit 14
VPVQTFCLIPQSSTHIRILYRNIYCIDVLIQSDGCVAIRDGAYSIFDKSKALEELTPIQSLKAFLNKFVDKSLAHTRRHSQNEDDNPPSPVTQMEPHSVDSCMSASGYSISKSNINSPLPAMSDHGNSALSNALRGTSGLHTSNPNTPASPHTSLLSQTGYVPSPGMPEPSPGNMYPVNSPISSLHAPSPSPMHPQQSPAPPNSNSSNFNISMPSPVSSGWPNSPSLSRPSPSRPVQSPAQPMSGQSMQGQGPASQPPMAPHMSRVMPARSWAAAVPTLLTQNAFEAMCKPNAPIEANGLQTGNSVYGTLSQLERFLGCVFMRKNLQRFIQNDDTFSLIHTPEPGVIQFKNENMQFKISLHPLTMQSLHVKIQPLPECKVQWSPDELEILERFFESKVNWISFSFIDTTALHSYTFD